MGVCLRDFMFHFWTWVSYFFIHCISESWSRGGPWSCLCKLEIAITFAPPFVASLHFRSDELSSSPESTSELDLGHTKSPFTCFIPVLALLHAPYAPIYVSSSSYKYDLGHTPQKSNHCKLWLYDQEVICLVPWRLQRFRQPPFPGLKKKFTVNRDANLHSFYRRQMVIAGSWCLPSS